MSSKLLLNLQPDPNTGTLHHVVPTTGDEVLEVLRYELQASAAFADTVTLDFYDGDDSSGTLLGSVDIPAGTTVTGSPEWEASAGLYVEVSSGKRNWENSLGSTLDVATGESTDIRRKADMDTYDPPSIDLPIRLWHPLAGATSASEVEVAARLPGIQFPKGGPTTTYAVVRTVLPSAWDAADLALDIEWCADGGAPSGDTRWNLATDSWTDGETINTSPASVASTTGAQQAAQYTTDILTVATGFALDVTQRHTLRLGRIAGSSMDTETGSVAVVGAVLRKV